MENIIPIKAAFDAYSNWGGVYIKAGDYSVTDILNPPRVVHLRNRHKHELPQQTIMQLLKAFQGNAWHAFLEKQLRAANHKPEWRDQFLIEAKFWELIEGRKISGKLDTYYLPEKTLYDYKVTSIYKAIFGDYEDWETQLNVYAWFLNRCKFPVDKIRIICIHPEWKEFEMMKDPRYPRQPIHEIELNVWPTDLQTGEVTKRIVTLRDTETLSDDDLPECTPADMWLKDSTFALMEPGKKRATRVLSSMDEMTRYIDYRASKGTPIDPNYKIVEREAERTRCDTYCEVSGFCNQDAEYRINKEMGS